MKTLIATLAFLILGMSFANAASIEEVLQKNLGNRAGKFRGDCSLRVKFDGTTNQPWTITYNDNYVFVGSWFPNSTWVHFENENFFEIRSTDLVQEGSLRLKYHPSNLEIYEAVLVNKPGGCKF